VQRFCDTLAQQNQQHSNMVQTLVAATQRPREPDPTVMNVMQMLCDPMDTSENRYIGALQAQQTQFESTVLRIAERPAPPAHDPAQVLAIMQRMAVFSV